MITINNKEPETIFIDNKEVSQIEINNDVVWTKTTSQSVTVYSVDFVEQSNNTYNCYMTFGQFDITQYSYCWLNALETNYPNWTGKLIYGNNIVSFDNSDVIRYDEALIVNLQTIPTTGDYCTIHFYDNNNNEIFIGGSSATVTPYIPSSVLSNLTFTLSSTVNEYFVSGDIEYSGSWDTLEIKVERAIGDRYWDITCTPSQVTNNVLDTTPATFTFNPSDTWDQYAEVYFYLNGVEVASDTQVVYTV